MLHDSFSLYFSLSAYPSSPPSIHVEIPSFKTVMTAATEVKATCLVQTLFDATVTWLMEPTVLPSSTVTRSTNTTHIISEVTVSSSQWKQLKRITCKAVHKCFSSTEKVVAVAGKTTEQYENQVFVTAKNEGHLLCFLSVSSRACSYSSISGDQEISPRFAKGGHWCAGV